MANIQHKVIPDADLHEPKGVASAQSKQVYVANGAGSGVWTKYVESAETTITAGTAATFTHGLGAVPARFEVVMRCKTTDVEFNVGDEVYPQNFDWDGFNNMGVTLSADTTTVYATVGNGGIRTLFKNSAVVAGFTLSKWKFVFRAWSY